MDHYDVFSSERAHEALKIAVDMLLTSENDKSVGYRIQNLIKRKVSQFNGNSYFKKKYKHYIILS